MSASIRYSTESIVTPSQFVDLLNRSTLGARRPIDQPEVIEAMLRNASLVVSAWEGDALIGVARSVTDFAYCCYLSDLAVDTRCQHGGIGRELIERTRAALGPHTKIILLAAPQAVGYYPRIGFTRHDSAWTLGRDDPLV